MGRKVAGLPPWIRFTVPGGASYVNVKKVLSSHDLHTVCMEARCPNIGECFGRGTATFLILGPVCTRNCRYCAVVKGIPDAPDFDEPERIASAVSQLKLQSVVITSVTRDDLPDGGAGIFAATIARIRERNNSCKIEVLVPDFMHTMESSLEVVAAQRPDVINHNIEIAGSLFEMLRPMGSYRASLRLLKHAAATGITAKSGLMVGFGETMEDIERTLKDLSSTGCAHITVGQYLQSRLENVPVEKFYSPDEFKQLAVLARDMGFSTIQSGPLVRSSYHALECMD